MTEFIRSAARGADQLRPVRITRGYTVHAEGSVPVSYTHLTLPTSDLV